MAIPERVHSGGCDRCAPDRLGAEDAAREPANETGVPRSLRPKERLTQTAPWGRDPRAPPGSDLTPHDPSDSDVPSAAGPSPTARSASRDIVHPVRGFLPDPAAVGPRPARSLRVPGPGLDHARGHRRHRRLIVPDVPRGPRPPPPRPNPSAARLACRSPCRPGKGQLVGRQVTRAGASCEGRSKSPSSSLSPATGTHQYRSGTAVSQH